MSLIEILALLLLLLSAGMVAAAFLQRNSVEDRRGRELRCLALASELAHARETRARMEAFQDQVANTLDQSGRAARATHRAITNIPFDILEQIPATREGARHVRRLHDVAADSVYAGLSLYARWRGQRRRAPLDAPESPAPDLLPPASKSEPTD